MDKLIEIVAEVLEIEPTEVSAAFEYRKHAAWDSLAALTLIASLEDEFGVVLGDAELREATTVQALFDIVQSRK